MLDAVKLENPTSTSPSSVACLYEVQGRNTAVTTLGRLQI